MQDRLIKYIYNKNHTPTAVMIGVLNQEDGLLRFGWAAYNNPKEKEEGSPFTKKFGRDVIAMGRTEKDMIGTLKNGILYSYPPTKLAERVSIAAGAFIERCEKYFNAPFKNIAYTEEDKNV